MEHMHEQTRIGFDRDHLVLIAIDGKHGRQRG
jgi:hypothetical protein